MGAETLFYLLRPLHYVSVLFGVKGLGAVGGSDFVAFGSLKPSKVSRQESS